MTQDKTNKVSNVPPLRFPEFTGEWEKCTLGEIMSYSKDRVPSNTLTDDNYVSTENMLPHFGGIYRAPNVPSNGNAIAYQKGDTLLSNIRPYLKKVWLANNNGGCSADVFVLKSVNEKCNSDFLYYLVANDNFINYVMNGAKGVKMPRGDKEQIKKYQLSIPSKNEQCKITDLLSKLDQRISTQIRVIEDLQTLKKAIRKQMFSELLLDNAPNLQIKDVLEYEQPTKYLVSNTEYSDDITLIPVLTANKAFVLGYTDDTDGIYSQGKCIIIDDFTLDCKLVDFPFKVKSSAIKILTAKRGTNIRYLYEYLKFLDLDTSEHKRHYIAEIEPLEIVIPNMSITNGIANTLELMDKRIGLAENMLFQYRQQKQYLLQQMFI